MPNLTSLTNFYKYIDLTLLLSLIIIPAVIIVALATIMCESIILPILTIVVMTFYALLSGLQIQSTINNIMQSTPILTIFKDLIPLDKLNLALRVTPLILLAIAVAAGIAYKVLIAKIKDKSIEDKLLTILQLMIKHGKLGGKRISVTEIIHNITMLLSISFLIGYILVKVGLKNATIDILTFLPLSLIFITYLTILGNKSLITNIIILMSSWMSPILFLASILDFWKTFETTYLEPLHFREGIRLGLIKALLTQGEGKEYNAVSHFKDRVIVSSTTKWKWVEVDKDYYFNPYKQVNPHVMISGTSGSGKSFTTAIMLAKMHTELNIGYLVIDFHGEYLDKLKTIGLKYVNYINALHNTINLLDLEGQPPNLRASEIADVVKNLFNLGPLQRLILQRVLEEAYALAEITDDPSTWNKTVNSSHVIQAYRKLLSMTENEQELRVLKSLEPYIKTISSSIITQSKINISELLSRPTILDLSHIPSIFIKRLYVSALLMKIYYNLPRIKPSRLTYIVIDEAHRVIKENEDVLVKLFAESRKYNIGLIIITQNPKDIPNSIVSNTSLQIFLKLVEPSNIEYAAKILGGYSSNDRIDHIKRALYYLPQYHGIVKDSLIREPLIVDLTWRS